MLGRLEDDIAMEQVEAVLQAAFTNFRGEDAANNVAPNRERDRVAEPVNTTLLVRSAAAGVSS